MRTAHAIASHVGEKAIAAFLTISRFFSKHLLAAEIRLIIKVTENEVGKFMAEISPDMGDVAIAGMPWPLAH